MASARPTSSASFPVGCTSSTFSTGVGRRLVPITYAPKAFASLAVCLPMPPSPATSTVCSCTCLIAQRPVHCRWACCACRRGRSFAPASTPNIANSASVGPCTPAEVVNTTRSSSGAVNPAAFTWAPPPAAMRVHPPQPRVGPHRRRQCSGFGIRDPVEDVCLGQQPIERDLLLC